MNWSLIKEKLTLLTQRKEALKLFGANEHQFISRKVPEYQMKWFEFKHRISLPSEYRAFLTTIGYGAGPNYGIHSLTQSIKWLNDWNDNFQQAYSLHKPFELSTRDAVRLMQQRTENPESCFSQSLTQLNGLLPISYEGCAFHTYLVITGEQRGYLWSYCEDDALTEPIGPHAQFTFLEWYHYWINDCLEKIEEKTA
jgi:hypothetical protein